MVLKAIKKVGLPQIRRLFFVIFIVDCQYNIRVFVGTEKVNHRLLRQFVLRPRVTDFKQ